jgi:RimJ/RimL family protein N-acetyltransferase
VGDLALHVDADEPRQAEVGFTLAPAHQGQGLATEALTGVLDWAFPAFGLHRVIAITDALNTSAAALLDRVGFRREAHFVENVFFKGAWGSEFSFAVLDHEWAARRA